MGDGLGPGVQRFWELVHEGNEVDLAQLQRAFPEETAALARAAVEAAKQHAARTRELLWRTRHQVLLSNQRDVTLGETLRQRRQSLGLSERALMQRLAQDGVQVLPQAIQQLEANRLSPFAVQPARTWRGVADALALDPALLMSLLELSAQQPPEPQQFTRMARGATEEDRAQFLTESREDDADNTRRYLDEVRRELGLPPRRAP